MKSQELVSKVQDHAKKTNIAASKACEALGINPSTYYAARQRLKKSSDPVAKAKPAAKAAAVVKRRPGRPAGAVANAPSQSEPLRVSWGGERTFLVVGTAGDIAEVARALK